MTRPGPAVVSLALLVAQAGCSLLVDTDVGVRADGGAGGDGGGGADGGATEGACGTVGRLQDEFGGSELSGQWVSRREGTYLAEPKVAGGELAIDYLAGVPGDAGDLSEVESLLAYDLRAASVSVRVAGIHPAWESNLEIRAPGDDNPSFGIGTVGAFLTAWTRDPPGQAVAFASDPYDPAIHRYWRIREVEGAVELETAGDDRRFGPFARLDDPAFLLDTVYVALAVRAGDASGDDGTIAYDELDEGVFAAPACPIAGLSDPLTTPAPGRLWQDRSEGCLIETGGGSLVATVPSTGRCELASAKGYSMEPGGSLAVELLQFPGDGGKLELRLSDLDGDLVTILQYEGTLRGELREGGVVVDDFEAPNVVDAQWWRIRESGGDLVIEVGDDGVDYDPRKSFAVAALELREVRAALGLEATTGTVYTEIGGVNQAP